MFVEQFLCYAYLWIGFMLRGTGFVGKAIEYLETIDKKTAVNKRKY